MATTANINVTLPNDREIVMTRNFDAPRELVYDCYTKPEMLMRWMHGPSGWMFVVCDNDLRVGGAFRWLWRNATGEEMGMHGVYREIMRPERIVRTELFDQDWTGGETLGTLTLTESDNKTTLTMTVVYSSRQARDGALKSGMKEGVAASYAKLDALLTELNRMRSAA